MPISPGARLGAYEILSPLGAGGMGEVYKVRDTRLDRTVAIKVLPSHLADKPQLLERSRRAHGSDAGPSFSSHRLSEGPLSQATQFFCGKGQLQLVFFLHISRCGGN